MRELVSENLWRRRALESISRCGPRKPLSRTESWVQISLLAEFHDLDTGIFVDSTETEGVLLTQMQIDELKTNFEAHHVAEYKEHLR